MNSEFEERLRNGMTEIDTILGPTTCGLCDRDIAKSVKIKCLECQEKALYMCLECLRTGKSSNDSPEHKSNHSYYVFDQLKFPLFTKDWFARDELLLL